MNIPGTVAPFPVLITAIVCGCACNCETSEEELLSALGVTNQGAQTISTAGINQHANAFLVGKPVAAFALDTTHPPKSCALRTAERIDCIYVYREGVFFDELLRVVITVSPGGTIASVAVSNAN